MLHNRTGAGSIWVRYFHVMLRSVLLFRFFLWTVRNEQVPLDRALEKFSTKTDTGS
jgi:hypothetical protein